VVIDADDGIRPGTTPASLGQLRPVFKKGGSTTAGNSSQASAGRVVHAVRAVHMAGAGLSCSCLVLPFWLPAREPNTAPDAQSKWISSRLQVTDGAAAVMLMTRQEAAKRGLPILGIFRRWGLCGCNSNYHLVLVQPGVCWRAALRQPASLAPMLGTKAGWYTWKGRRATGAGLPAFSIRYLLSPLHQPACSAVAPVPVRSFAAVGVPPAVMGIGPAVAIPAAVSAAAAAVVGRPCVPAPQCAFCLVVGAGRGWGLTLCDTTICQLPAPKLAFRAAPSHSSLRWRWRASRWTTLTCTKSTRPSPRRWARPQVLAAAWLLLGCCLAAARCERRASRPALLKLPQQRGTHLDFLLAQPCLLLLSFLPTAGHLQRGQINLDKVNPGFLCAQQLFYSLFFVFRQLHRPPTAWTSWALIWTRSTPTEAPLRWDTRWAAPARARWAQWEKGGAGWEGQLEGCKGSWAAPARQVGRGGRGRLGGGQGASAGLEPGSAGWAAPDAWRVSASQTTRN